MQFFSWILHHHTPLVSLHTSVEVPQLLCRSLLLITTLSEDSALTSLCTVLEMSTSRSFRCPLYTDEAQSPRVPIHLLMPQLHTNTQEVHKTQYGPKQSSWPESPLSAIPRLIWWYHWALKPQFPILTILPHPQPGLHEIMSNPSPKHNLNRATSLHHLSHHCLSPSLWVLSPAPNPFTIQQPVVFTHQATPQLKLPSPHSRLPLPSGYSQIPDLSLSDLNFMSLISLHSSPFPFQRPCICFFFLLETYFLLHPYDPVATFLSSFRSQLKRSILRNAFLVMLARTPAPLPALRTH